MDFRDRIVATLRMPGRNARHRAATPQWVMGDEVADDVLFELSSIDMTVTFFDDHLTYRRRLGSRHGVVPYRNVRGVRLTKRPSGLIRISKVGSSETPETLAAAETSQRITKKLTLTADGYRHAIAFDFRNESIESVQEAFVTIQRGMTQTTLLRDGEDVAIAREHSTSTADELWKLAHLRNIGVLTAEEFEIEKSRLLND